MVEVDDKDDASAEERFIGRIDGFRFVVGGAESLQELKTPCSVSAAASEFARRADKLYSSPDFAIDLTEQGGLMWEGGVIGKLEPGAAILTPRVRVFVDEVAGPDVAERVERRLMHWIDRKVQGLFEPLLAMRDDEAITGIAKGVAACLAEGMGVVPRRRIANDVRQLAQEDRSLLRKHGVRFGQYNIFVVPLLKPAPTRLRLALWSLWRGFGEIPEAPPPGCVTVPAVGDAPEGFYEMTGYRLCGRRALRIDMLERLANLFRPMDARAGFEAQPDMLSITGCTLEQFADIMQSLGFKAERGERLKPPPESPFTRGEATPEEIPDAAAGAAGEIAAVGVKAKAAPADEAAAERAAPDSEVFYTFTLPRRSVRTDESRGRLARNAKGGNQKRGNEQEKANGKNGQRGKAKSRPPRREKPVDPDNPFAVLQKLKKV